MPEHVQPMVSIRDNPDFVTNLIDSLTDAVRYGGVTAGVLLIEHLALWHVPYRIPRPLAYVLGVITLGIGFTGWGFRRYPLAVIAWWIIAACGGCVVTLAYWIRWVQAETDRLALLAGRIAGRESYGNQQTPTSRN